MYRKVFAICMLDSIHTARWLRQFEGEHIEFMLFPSSPHRGLHPFLKELLENRSNARFRVVPFGRLFGFPLWIVDKFFDNFFRGTLARVFIKNFQPTIVHALELQNAGYIALKALRNYKPKTLSLITTNWGSDIFWFQRFPKHKARLEQLMDLSDFHSAECSRDLGLARDLGFAGSFLPVIPNAGGFHDEILDSEMLPSASRTIILVKGYQGWVGRAKIAIEAIGEMANELSNYEIIIYSANHVTKRVAKAVASETELRFTVNGKGALTHSNLLAALCQGKGLHRAFRERWH